jgi:hypothetical protein
MELAASRRGNQPGGLNVAGIPFVFTIARVAEMLGEDEEWLYEISINMDPEEGCLWVLGVGDREVVAFTEFGVESLRQIIIEERASAAARKPHGDP